MIREHPLLSLVGFGSFYISAIDSDLGDGEKPPLWRGTGFFRFGVVRE
jgi:hypothetical protein